MKQGAGGGPVGVAPPRGNIGSVVTVSSHIIVARLAWFIYSKADSRRP